MNLSIAGFDIKQDNDGRYCLNDFHKASGGAKKHGPSFWMANAQTQELIEELGDTGNPVSVLRGGKQQGTFVCKELVYAYAMWVSPKFHLHVIRTYDQAVLAEMAEHRRVTSMALQVANMKLEVATKQVELVEELNREMGLAPDVSPLLRFFGAGQKANTRNGDYSGLPHKTQCVERSPTRNGL